MARFRPRDETVPATRNHGPERGRVGNCSTEQAPNGGPFDHQTWVLGTRISPPCLQIRQLTGTLGEPSMPSHYSLHCKTSLRALTMYSKAPELQRSMPQRMCRLRRDLALPSVPHHTTFSGTTMLGKQRASPPIRDLSCCCTAMSAVATRKLKRTSDFSCGTASHWDIVARSIGVDLGER